MATITINGTAMPVSDEVFAEFTRREVAAAALAAKVKGTERKVTAAVSKLGTFTVGKDKVTGLPTQNAAKGGIKIMGINKTFPVTLYATQMVKLFGAKDLVKKAILDDLDYTSFRDEADKATVVAWCNDPSA